MNSQNFDISSKWIIEGFPYYVIGSDKEIYRLPFVSNKNYYELRKIKRQPHNRWLLNGKFWSIKQLKPKIKLNSNPQILITKQSKAPF